MGVSVCVPYSNKKTLSKKGWKIMKKSIVVLGIFVLFGLFMPATQAEEKITEWDSYLFGGSRTMAETIEEGFESRCQGFYSSNASLESLKEGLASLQGHWEERLFPRWRWIRLLPEKEAKKAWENFLKEKFSYVQAISVPQMKAEAQAHHLRLDRTVEFVHFDRKYRVIRFDLGHGWCLYRGWRIVGGGKEISIGVVIFRLEFYGEGGVRPEEFISFGAERNSDYWGYSKWYYKMKDRKEEKKK